jgi:L-aspartate oxidase
MPEGSFDLIVVGSGAAGLSAALRAAERGAHVAVLTAGALLAGSSPRAQGGVAAAVGADDAPALHTADTLAVGAGLNDASAVDVLTHEGRRSVRQLWDEGVPFADDLGLEAGHARRRILHAGGGATGQVLTSALLERAVAHERIALFEHSPVAELLTDASSRVVGVRIKASPRARSIVGRAVVLATGGYAALWGRSTNAPESRGSGLALAFGAGAALADLEFVQFHPTALSIPGRPAYLLSEALRGEGAQLLDADDKPVVDPLLPRDVVARALHRQLRRGPVYLSLRHLDPDRVRQQFEQIATTLKNYDLDLARDRLPVAPAAHYCMGGVRTDTWGRTNVPGLYAAGEVACTGVQGANRLASNSLLECLVFGARAADAALQDSSESAATWHTAPLPGAESVTTAHAGADSRVLAMDPTALGERLDRDVGVERSRRPLTRFVAELPDPDAVNSSDLLLTSVIARSALLRTESRGAHFRTDCPESDPRFRGRIHWRRDVPPAFEEVAPLP